jgi:hypothetical protein
MIATRRKRILRRVSIANNPVAASTYTYDAASRLTDLAYTAQSGTPAAYHWDYNTAGQVSDFYSRGDSNAGTPDTTYVAGTSNWGRAQYGYDPTAQLTSTAYSNFNNPPTSVSGREHH